MPDTLDVFEEGQFLIPVRRHWYQFWLPKYAVAGSYTRIGNTVSISSTHFPYRPATVFFMLLNEETK